MAVSSWQQAKIPVKYLPTANCQLPTCWKFVEIKSLALKVQSFN